MREKIKNENEKFTVETIFGDVDVNAAGNDEGKDFMEFGRLVRVGFCSWFPNGKTWSVMVFNRVTRCYYTVAYYDNRDAAYREAYVLDTCIKSFFDVED